MLLIAGVYEMFAHAGFGTTTAERRLMLATAGGMRRRSLGDPRPATDAQSIALELTLPSRLSVAVTA